MLNYLVCNCGRTRGTQLSTTVFLGFLFRFFFLWSRMQVSNQLLTFTGDCTFVCVCKLYIFILNYCISKFTVIYSRIQFGRMCDLVDTMSTHTSCCYIWWVVVNTGICRSITFLKMSCKNEAVSAYHFTTYHTQSIII